MSLKAAVFYEYLSENKSFLDSNITGDTSNSNVSTFFYCEYKWKFITCQGTYFFNYIFVGMVK